MVSGRHRAYEPADSGDSLSNDTSASAFSLDLTVIKDAKINKRHVMVSGQKFSRRAIDNLVDEALNASTRTAFPSIRGYDGRELAVVEAHGQAYIGLVKLKSGGGFMNFIVYDFTDEKVKKARTRFERMDIEQVEMESGSSDYEYDDFVEKLEKEYRNR